MMVTDNLQESFQQWLHHDDGWLVVHSLSFLDFKTLVQKFGAKGESQQDMAETL
jgi:hypothetical protein